MTPKTEAAPSLLQQNESKFQVLARLGEVANKAARDFVPARDAHAGLEPACRNAERERDQAKVVYGAALYAAERIDLDTANKWRQLGPSDVKPHSDLTRTAMGPDADTPEGVAVLATAKALCESEAKFKKAEKASSDAATVRNHRRTAALHASDAYRDAGGDVGALTKSWPEGLVR